VFAGGKSVKVAVLGAGAIGSLIGGRMAAAGVPVTLIDRGERARALQQHGLTIVNPDGSLLRVPDIQIAQPRDPQTPHDLVVLAMKAQDIAGALPTLTRLLHADTAVLTVQNGIPWWYFQGIAGAHSNHTLQSVDPAGRIAGAIETRRIIGCVAYPAAAAEPAGITRHVEGYRFPIGELDGSSTPRAQAISALLTGAGFKAPILADVRAETWLKAWGNLGFNPVSALTRATMAGICQFPETRALVEQMMLEAQQIAARLGVQFRVSLERRLQGAEQVGHHKTSMLQDVAAGRPLEIEAVVGAVLELGRLTGVNAPMTQAIYSLAKLLDRSAAGGADSQQRGSRIT
jgi:2-dehydropantoate 2-reductase